MRGSEVERAFAGDANGGRIQFISFKQNLCPGAQSDDPPAGQGFALPYPTAMSASPARSGAFGLKINFGSCNQMEDRAFADSARSFGFPGHTMALLIELLIIQRDNQ
jgi:hypothetical protein